VTTTVKSTSRGKQLGRPLQAWQPTTSPGRAVAVIPAPVPLVTPTQQYAVRTPSAEQADGDHDAVLVTSRLDRSLLSAGAHDAGRAGRDADRTRDQRGVGVAVLRQRTLAAHAMLVWLVQLAHNVLIWARRWLTVGAPRLGEVGSVRLVRAVWAVPGRVTRVGPQVQRVRLGAAHPRAREVCRGLQRLCPASQTLLDWG
jgi:hypothetical protein